MNSLVRLVFWGTLWLVAWIATTIVRGLTKQPRLDNCLTWALRRWDEKGGYLVVRWCRSSTFHWMRWPHFLWLPEEKHQELRHFLPRDDDGSPDLWPDPWFEGYVQTGDDEDVREN